MFEWNSEKLKKGNKSESKGGMKFQGDSFQFGNHGQDKNFMQKFATGNKWEKNSDCVHCVFYQCMKFQDASFYILEVMAQTKNQSEN